VSILYITSFSGHLYNLTGKRLIETFKKTKTEGDLFCYVEGMDTSLINGKNITVEDMSDNRFYRRWFEANLDIIPEKFGGKATKESSFQAFKTPNYRTAQWTKKIATMKYAMENYTDQYDYFMWVDCDCFFTNTFTEQDLVKALQGKSFGYHLGRDRTKKRMGVETGLLGFKNDKYSKKALSKWIKKYNGAGFKQHEWWNDAHMFFYVLDANPKLKEKGIDLVTDYGDTGRSKSHVIMRGDLGNFFDHQKGYHKRNL
jgi:hypothetical protein